VTLQVTEHAGLSDVGRQRDANEDNWVIAPPFYVVADGMGGAKAGEVASRLAAEAFMRGAADSGTPEQVLERRAQDANKAIFDLAEKDESHRGMGTTLTAALVSGDEVSIGHVGDSRAYRLRGDELEQLTHDHSLVAELERSGQITREAAEVHPQRSIITRALGPEPSVEVDTHTHRAQAGDVYLLCSDGLTGMISDRDVTAILRGAGDLESAADALVLAANQSGGKDNITVVLFRIDAADGAPPLPPEGHTLSGAETIHQGLTADDVQAAVAEQERAGAVRRDTPAPVRRPATAAAPRRRGPRRLVTALVSLLVVGAIAAGLLYAGRQVYFVGTNDQGLLTLYRGLPYELPLGIDLYSEQAVSGVPARSLPKRQRDRILDHEWRGKADAEDLVEKAETGELDSGETRPGGGG
jgi:protein phosphatase